MVIKDWRCPCGNVFESGLPICPSCGASEPYVTRTFTKPPAFKSDSTKFKDESLSDFTKTYGLSDFTNNQSQKHEKDYSSLWKPVGDLVADPSLASGGEAALIKKLMPESSKAVVGAERIRR